MLNEVRAALICSTRKTGVTAATEILIGASVRALAEGALEEGRFPICVDQFGDRDLLERLAQHQLPHHQIETFEQAALLDLPSHLPITLSGGAEHCETLLRCFDERLAGTGIAHRKHLHPAMIFPAFQNAGFSIPQWSLTCPRDTEGWLCKKITGAGGTHVQPASDQVDADYFQQLVTGRSVSAVYHVSSNDCRLLATMKQFSGRKELNAPGYFFCGNSGPETFSKAFRKKALSIGRFSADYLGLSGTFGIDFLQTHDDLLPIDWNLRPPASLELFQLSNRFLNQSPLVRWIIYAGRSTRVTDELSDLLMNHTRRLRCHPPEFWLADIPAANSEIKRGTPFCSLYSPNRTAAQAAFNLNERLPEQLRFQPLECQ